ncbi:Geranial dehydrogenase [Burkholderia pseudomultivorans]|uniref:Geranial dehydrogenase n=2 Tax=Burkholderiaceae TaxID=119060 RepID=A0ABU2E5J3_9BURK|nr:aldehyde dehydrogenase [Burkholderia cenocepacia]MDR8729068.1 Geranial dehydrogenase [Burkholderia pseudomultivorans]TCT26573.1 betaine-aldehyde dehydrogenase [Burkholderia vietnamiensis]MDR8737386.1 Geranial dehydrogenase [Burkholderia pseudomultivorans]MDR8743639.1 Geranial dehydrogenase [Burkholderia pseudomultivorans]
MPTISAINSNASSPPLRHPDKLFIGGKWINASSDAKFSVIAPHTEDVYVTVAEAGRSDINKAVAAARAAFDHGPWPSLSHAERAKYLHAIAERLRARAGDMAEIWPNEMGVTSAFAQAHMPRIADIYDFYATLGGSFGFEEQHQTSSGVGKGLLVREPVGVVGAIIPWNAPAMLIAYKLAPALIAGCTVVLKSSPEAPGMALIVAEAAEDVGLPAGVLNVVTADRDASDALVRNQSIDKITFTGSSAVGKHIASVLAERVGRFTLELGGKSAAVILEDYDVETAAKILAAAATQMTCQVCAALTRIIVPKSRHDQFLDALGAAYSAVKVGSPFDPETQMGPVATFRQRERVESYINKGKEAGFTLAAGGRRPPHLPRGYFIEPTVFGNVDNGSVLAQEEIFGPVLAVIPAESEARAIEMANDTVYGLSGAVFTNDVDRAYAVARQLRTGTVAHNGFRNDFGIAFGGFKQSGIGREGGIEGLMPYLETKTLLLDSLPSKHLKS